MDALEKAISLGLDEKLDIATPLMFLDKAETWGLADKIGGVDLVELIRTETHTCYVGERSELHAWGYGCGTCPACELREKGWLGWQEHIAS